MKKLFLLLGFCLFSSVAWCQISPTLGVGLESLTLNKGTIDVKVLTEIIMDKQKELKQEALKRFMLSMFPETNYTTKFYVQSCLTILFNEKNPQVIEKQILELTTNYALALGVAKVYMLKPTPQVKYVDSCYKVYQNHSTAYKGGLLENYKVYKTDEYRLKPLTDSLYRINAQIDADLKNVHPNEFKGHEKYYDILDTLERNRKKLDKQINRIKLRKNIAFVSEETKAQNKVALPFGIALDVVSSALSGIDELKKKGFYKQSIDYRNDNFYINLKPNNETLLKKSLDSLSITIAKDITPYITNYDIIKEFFSTKSKDQIKDIDIKESLITDYTIAIRSIVGTDKLGASMLKTINGVENAKLFKQNSLEIIEINKKLDNLNAYDRGLNALQNYPQKLKAIEDTLNAIQSNYNHALISNDPFPKELNGIQFKNLEDSLKKIIDTSHREIVCNLIYRYASTKLSKDTLESLLIQVNNIRKQFSSLNNVLKPGDTQPNSLNNLRDEGNVLKTVWQDSLINRTKALVVKGDFTNEYLKNILQNVATTQNLVLQTEIDANNKEAFEGYTSLFSTLFQHLNDLSKKQTISLNDIHYIDNEVVPELIRLGIIFKDKKDNDNIQDKIKDLRILSQLLKIRAVLEVGSLKQYTKEFGDLFAFVANLDNLDKAETYETMLNMLEDANNRVIENLEDGKFKNVYILFSNAIKKYTIINTKDQYIQIDVVSFLTDLQQYSDRNNDTWLGLYLTLGLNQNVFFHPVMLPGSTDYIKYIGFASEKIGLKFRLANFNKLSGYENAVKTDVNLNKRAPFVNQVYAIVYGSGLLYSVANTATSVNFDYPHIGTGLGIRFYNALDVNFVIGFPFIKNEPITKNAFYGIGLDIPLGEYLEKIGQKN